MTIADLTQQESWERAQAGDMGAIARLIAFAINPSQRPSPVKVEASRRDGTLYVFLTAAPPRQLETYLQAIRAVVSALNLTAITQLKVLDGAEKRLLNRWQYDFSLAPAPSAAPPPQPARLALAESAPGTESIALAPAAAGDRRPSPAEPRRRGWMVLPAAIALGFGLAAGVTQWRYGQQPNSARPSEPQDTEVASNRSPEATPTASLPAGALSDSAPAAAGAAPPPNPAPVALTIKAVGDIIPGTDYQRYRLPDDWQYLFRSIQYQLSDADITFGNFESTLTEVPNSAKDTSRGNTFAFRTPPWYASVLKEAGFDVLNVANNHSMDFFEQGFNDTIANIEAAGMQAVGRKGEILYVKAHGKTVAFIGFSTYSEHNSVNDLDTAIALVETAKQQADIVVVSFHGGKEGTDATVTRDQDEYFYSENRGNLVRFSHTVVDHGADLVLGHGPHVPRAIELYNHKLIAYSLGNFLGYRSLSTVGPLGISLILQADLDAQGNLVGGRIIPVALDKNGVPYLDDHFGSVVLLRQFTRRDFPDTPLKIDDLGYIWPQ
ncbi:CapA family protein [Nodosilinea nodulosa]|uniref:CapA family protein n=1 Tax=Nodosilinea nodulosa TaxID=416001 RepID=UPI0002F61073|nr:CapA family protein [Nodosilinea nodulosa]